MPDLPEKIVLHIGAHKTASTHLQQSIGATGRMDGVAFFGPPRLRGKDQSIKARFGLGHGAPVETVRDALVAMAGGAHRLVISDENFAGGLQTGWGKIRMPIYPQAADRVGALAAAIVRAGGPKLDLCIAIRDPAAYLTSAYSQVLHGGRVVRPEKFREKNPVTDLDWADYICRLRAVPLIGDLTVWRQEDHLNSFAQVCRALLGRDDVAPLQERVQQRLSASALKAVLRAKEAGLPNMVAEAAQQYPVTENDPVFDLYDDQTRQASAVRYAAQWADIKALEGVTTLQPNPA